MANHKTPLLDDKQVDHYEENNTLGIIYYILAGSFKCLGLMFGKLLYDRNASLVPNTLIMYRAIMATLILYVYLNRRLVKVMTVPRQSWNSLLIRMV